MTLPMRIGLNIWPLLKNSMTSQNSLIAKLLVQTAQNIIFKNFTKKPLVNNIINASIKLSHFPSHWKISSVVPILKKDKDKTEPISYRPISLLQTMNKITERVILRRLNDYENKEKHIANHQFGFKKNHSTVQQIVRIVNDVSINFNKNLVTVMLLLDIEKAFDKVWIDGLIYKMIYYNYPPTLIKYISSYLK